MWDLDELGILQLGEKKEIKRNGQGMILNNNGDIVDLLNPEGEIIDSVTYSRVKLEEYLYFH